MKNKKNIVGMIKYAIILIAFLLLTNPGLLPFLNPEMKAKATELASGLFGDVTQVSKMIHFNWITVFQLVISILVLLIAKNLITLICHMIKPKTERAKTLLSIIESLLTYSLIIIEFVWAMVILGVNVGTIFASVGVIALVVGFGAETLIEDLITGVFMIIENQYNVGDTIEINGFRGKVDKMGIRTTVLRDVGNNIKIINNSDMRSIMNRSADDSVALCDIGISYDTDLLKAEELFPEMLEKIYEAHDTTMLEVPIYIGVQELKDSCVLLRFMVKVKEQSIFQSQRDLNRELLIAFKEAGIDIPLPQVVLHK